MTYSLSFSVSFLLGVAVTMVLRALTTPAGPSTETIEQISAYGFAGALRRVAPRPGRRLGARLGDLTGTMGRVARSRRFSRLRGTGLPRAARLGRHVHDDARAPARDAVPRRASSAHSLWLWLGGASRVPRRRSSCSGTIGGRRARAGSLPTFIVDSRAKKRREQVERALPDLIDLLVVTLEAGLSFPQSLRLARREDPRAALVARSA